MRREPLSRREPELAPAALPRPWRRLLAAVISLALRDYLWPTAAVGDFGQQEAGRFLNDPGVQTLIWYLIGLPEHVVASEIERLRREAEAGRLPRLHMSRR